MTDIWTLLGGRTFAERLDRSEEKDEESRKRARRRVSQRRKSEPQKPHGIRAA